MVYFIDSKGNVSPVSTSYALNDNQKKVAKKRAKDAERAASHNLIVRKQPMQDGEHVFMS